MEGGGGVEGSNKRIDTETQKWSDIKREQKRMKPGKTTSAILQQSRAFSSNVAIRSIQMHY